MGNANLNLNEKVYPPRNFVVMGDGFGKITYSDGTVIREFQSKDDNIFYALYALHMASTTDSPNMTTDEYLNHLKEKPGFYPDHELTESTYNEFIERTKPYITTDSDGGTDITVAEMMEIADGIKNDYKVSSSKKPWYKFW
jgi:hypothetical protein